MNNNNAPSLPQTFNNPPPLLFNNNNNSNGNSLEN